MERFGRPWTPAAPQSACDMGMHRAVPFFLSDSTAIAHTVAPAHVYHIPLTSFMVGLPVLSIALQALLSYTRPVELLSP